MKSLGYLAGQDAAPVASGVVLHERGEAWDGLNFYTSGHAPEAVLMDMDGAVLHRWRRAHEEVFPGRTQRVPAEGWRRARLLPDGGVLALYAAALEPRIAVHRQRTQLARRLAAGDSSTDLMSLDPVFVPEFANAGWLRPFEGEQADQVLDDDVLRGAAETVTWEDQVVAAPQWANTQVLWYRKSLAEAAGLDMSGPVTWDQVIDACRAFLLDTSVLGQLSAPLCDALTGRGDARQMLDHLERANLLLFPLDAERNWYRYHRLFASFLQHRLAAQTG